MAQFRYSDGQWRKVCVEVSEPRPSGNTLQAARHALEEGAANYLEGARHADKRRSRRAENQRLLERMQRIASKLDGITDLKRHIGDALDANHETAKRHAGRSNPQRQMLYDLALTIWTETLQQKASSWRPNEANVVREPSGPTVRFLDAALRPLHRASARRDQ